MSQTEAVQEAQQPNVDVLLNRLEGLHGRVSEMATLAANVRSRLCGQIIVGEQTGSQSEPAIDGFGHQCDLIISRTNESLDVLEEELRRLADFARP